VQGRTTKCSHLASWFVSSKQAPGQLFTILLAIGTRNASLESATVLCNQRSQSHHSSVDFCKLESTPLLMVTQVLLVGEGYLVSLLRDINVGIFDSFLLGAAVINSVISFPIAILAYFFLPAPLAQLSLIGCSPQNLRTNKEK
jgi:hypothetical protein